nr:MAG TPA: nucleoporin [Caudoviricetes sp.]
MKCWEVENNGSKSNRTQLLAQYQTGCAHLRKRP